MKEQLGLVHIYCGDGKGKTTAAFGLAVRAAGNGLNVVVAQFLKSGKTGELNVLRNLDPVTVVGNGITPKFVFQMNEEEKRETIRRHTEMFGQAARLCADGKCDLLVLDEIMSACTTGMFPLQKILDFIDTRPEHIEVVMTGRNPPQELIDRADYVTEMVLRKHPYEQGIPARQGVEF